MRSPTGHCGPSSQPAPTPWRRTAAQLAPTSATSRPNCGGLRTAPRRTPRTPRTRGCPHRGNRGLHSSSGGVTKMAGMNVYEVDPSGPLSRQPAGHRRHHRRGLGPGRRSAGRPGQAARTRDLPAVHRTGRRGVAGVRQLRLPGSHRRGHRGVQAAQLGARDFVGSNAGRNVWFLPDQAHSMPGSRRGRPFRARRRSPPAHGALSPRRDNAPPPVLNQALRVSTSGGTERHHRRVGVELRARRSSR